MNRLLLIVLTSAFLTSCGAQPNNQNDVKLNIGAQVDSCDNPDASIHCNFIGMPENLVGVMEIANINEPGQRLIIQGTFYKADGVTPYADVIIYAFHTDHEGYYSKIGIEVGVQKWHGHLHGWCKTDKNGKYQIKTIKPAPYPNNTMPAHIHAAIKEPGNKEPYYINDFVFDDDNLVTRQYLENLTLKGGTGVISTKEDKEGVLNGTRDITL